MIDIERRLADELRAAVADEPPLGFDPDEVADRAGRLRRKRRRAYSMAAGAAATTAVLTAVGVMVLGNPDDTGRTGGTPATTAPAKPTTSTPLAKPAACQDTPRGQEPPMGFPGSKQIVQRLDREVPEAIAEHLPGVSIEPSDPVQAVDCPPTVVAGYFLDDNGLALFLVHARPEFDDEQDRYARYAEIQIVRRIDEFTAEDGAVVVVYEAAKSKDGSEVVKGSPEDTLTVVRLGRDGMVSHASFSPGNTMAVADVVKLLGDPRLQFPIPQ
jgi:hypothetical protein